MVVNGSVARLNGILGLAALALLAGCGNPSGGTQPSPSPSPTATATPTPTPSPSPSPLACTPSGPASADFPAAPTIPDSPPPITSATVAGDVLTLTFSRGTPAFQVTPVAGTEVTANDGKGSVTQVKGTAGALLVLTGFRGDMQPYAGPADQTATGAELAEVRYVSQFEGVVSWAIGLARPGCANVVASGSTLTFTWVPSS